MKALIYQIIGYDL